MAVDSEQAMHFVVEVATDPCCAHTGRLRLEIESVAEHAAFPEKAAVAPRLVQRRVEVRQHAQRKARVRADRLMAADQLRRIAQIVWEQEIQRQMRRSNLLP